MCSCGLYHFQDETELGMLEDSNQYSVASHFLIRDPSNIFTMCSRVWLLEQFKIHRNGRAPKCRKVVIENSENAEK